MKLHRVLHVLGTAEEAGTSICHVVETLAEGVDPSRYQIEACFLRPGPLAERLQASQVKTTCVRWNASVKDPLGAMRYALLIRTGNFDIIHHHNGGRLLTGLSKHLTRAKTVLHLHGRMSESDLTMRTGSFPSVDACIANSRITAEHFKAWNPVVIYPGIDTSKVRTKRSHEGIVIGTAGRLEAIKRISYLIQAVAALQKEFSFVRLEIAGDGSLRSALEQECRDLGLSNVYFWGWQDELQPVMAGWDIFAMPSLDEGFGVAALEAMSACLPVVASSVGGLCELVEDCETGFLVNLHSPEELTKRLRELIVDAEKRMEMGRRGQLRAEEYFSNSKMVSQIVSLYDGLLNKT